MSSQPQRPLAPEALLQHRQWVRELARRLVADPAAADDLEQQTWLAALRSPPRHDASPRAWLATVLRSWLHKARRGDQRRGRREQLAAGGDPAPSTAEIVAQAEAHRAVVDAVFRLDEPLRTTVLLRFFEDLPAAEVAARTGVPLETVRSRLRRAVELLRVSLDGHAGGRAAWLAALAPLAQQAAVPAGVAATIVLGALVMNTTQKLMVAAVLLVGGATAFLVSMQDSPAPVPAGGPGGAATAAGVPATAGGNAAAEAADRSVAARAGVPVTVLVRTWSDEPIAGAVVDACVPQAQGAEANEYDRSEVITSSASTDAAGAVQFTSLAAGRWHFVAGKPGWCRAGVPDVALRVGVATEPVVIRLGSGHPLAGRVLTADGRAVAGATVCVFPTSSSLVRPRATTDSQGRFRFDALRAGPTAVAAALPGGTVSRVETVQIPDVNELDLVLRTGGVLVGRVTDQAGQPVAGARVVAETSGSGYYRPVSAEAMTNAEGRYRMDTLGEGMICRMRAAKVGFVQVNDKEDDNFDAQIPFRDGGTWTKDLVLGRGGRLVVTVRGPDGPVAGAVVTAHQRVLPGPWPTATADTNGVAKFAAVAPMRTIVAVRAEGLLQPGFPTNWWQALVDPMARGEFFVEVIDGAEATLVIELVRSSTIAGRVLMADETPLEGVTVNYANATDSVSAVVTGADGSFRMPGVRPGSVPLALAKTDFVVVGPTVADVPAAGDCTGLVLRMAPALRVHGTVRAAGGRLGEAFVQVSVVPDREQELLEEYRWSNTPRLPIAADGTYDVPLPRTEGRFAVRVVALAHPGATSPPVGIEPGKTSYQVDLELEAGLDLAGRVVAMGTSDAIAGARIRAEWLAPGIDRTYRFHSPELPPVRAVTDGDGNFVLRGLRSGRWEIYAIANGFLAETPIAAVPQTNQIVIGLPAELSLEGVVQYPGGQPVGQAQLWPEPQPGNLTTSMGIEQMTVSGPDGRFKCPRVAAGQYRISVSPPRTGAANFRRTKTGIVAAGTRDLRIVVEPGASIAGRVVDGEGRGIGGVSVGALLGTDDYRSGVETLLDGTFVLVGLEDGVSYTVTVNPSGRPDTNAYAKLQRPYVAAGTTGLEFVLQHGLAIAGVVIDAAGTPLQGVEVAAMPVGTESPYAPTGRSDKDGKFEIRGLQTGRYRLAIPAWNASGLLLTGGDDVAAGTADLRLVASEGARIRGVVVDENGEPLAGIDVDAKAAQAGVFGSAWTRTRVDGAFDVTGLVPDAAYDVTASNRGRVPAAQRGVAGKADLRLVLARGLEVQGRLLDGDGKALAGINLRFAHAGSNLRMNARTGDDGSFTATGMTEGSYAVEASMGTAERLEMVPCGTVDAGQRGVELRLSR